MYNVATRGLFRGLNPRVASMATLLVLGAGAAGVLHTERLETLVAAWRETLTPFLEWYYVVLVTLFLALVIWLGMGRYKDVRLGHDDEAPEFTTFSWLTMLFAAGMGVGLLFWAVAEPLSHYGGNPFLRQADAASAADLAMVLTFFHWGLNAWAIFALLALMLAYFAYRRGLPLALRSALHPLIGKYIHGIPGDIVDLLAILATTFGIATTLGLGIKQLGAGLGVVAGLDATATTHVVLIGGLMALAVVSVITGLQAGVRRISQANFWLSAALLALLLIWGPTQYLFALVAQSTGAYLQSLLALSFYTHANQRGDWHADWTVFYWGWWLAWAPFVGLFIARISRGRTLGEFVLGVLLTPALITFVWIGVLGGTALYAELFGAGGIAQAVREDITRATFLTLETLENVTVAGIAAILITVLITTYLVTSANAGIVVINTLLAHGSPDHRPLHIVIWGLALGLMTAVLLISGGVETLQAAVIAAALPFSVVMLLMVVGLLRALGEEPYAAVPGERTVPPAEPWQSPVQETDGAEASESNNA